MTTRPPPVADPAPADADDPLFVASLEKGMRVLDAFRDASDSLGLTDIATVTGLGKSAAQRFIHTWERMGYLIKDPASRRYRLAPRVVELGYFFLRSDRLVSMAAPHLVALRDRCGLAVHLSVLAGGDMIYLLRLPSRQLTLAEMLPGRRMPAWCNSGGRMLLAAQDDDAIRQVLRSVPPRAFTPRTVVDPDALLALIRQARDDGYALTEDQVLQNQVGAAVLLRDARDTPLAAISVRAPRHDYPSDRLLSDIVPQLFRTAQAIQHA
ncbi:IclR family transcriptional regulator C-terminal domain-containing protein [Achromobacter sp. Bel]|uniref:IclR family transcriptional regulator n=1 Tax=Achromobacter sp. Bel TaxID=2727415 RepID=UPI00145FB891|nr:IclR family transcriptional regulator C-terminal domain-containing protein [Achromobacter sp. Bel]NMK48932.1 helix-turn-helix domain-containing protein [Achromobacter sp. Bel]